MGILYDRSQHLTDYWTTDYWTGHFNKMDHFSQSLQMKHSNAIPISADGEDAWDVESNPSI